MHQQTGKKGPHDDLEGLSMCSSKLLIASAPGSAIGQFAAVAGDKDLSGRVNPDFFNVLIIEERLNQRPQISRAGAESRIRGSPKPAGECGRCQLIIGQVSPPMSLRTRLVLVRVQAAVAHCLTDILLEQSQMPALASSTVFSIEMILC